MKRKFSFSSPKRRGPSDPWFTVGNIEVTTTVFVVALGVLSMFVYAASKTLLDGLVLRTPDVRSGEIWRLVTWPIPNAPNIFSVITLAVFWYFGKNLEAMFGRVRYMKFLLALTVLPAFALTVLSFASPKLEVGAVGLSLIELGVFVAFVAEQPTMRFMFGIPAWILAAVFVGLDVLSFVGDRAWGSLLLLLFILATSLLVTRLYGFAAEQTWIPKLNLPKLGGLSGGKKKRSAPGSAVVAGPWAGSPVVNDTAAQLEMDRLLDKIASSGMDSLTPDEKRRLKAHSKRLRGD